LDRQASERRERFASQGIKPVEGDDKCFARHLDEVLTRRARADPASLAVGLELIAVDQRCERGRIVSAREPDMEIPRGSVTEIVLSCFAANAGSAVLARSAGLGDGAVSLFQQPFELDSCGPQP